MNRNSARLTVVVVLATVMIATSVAPVGVVAQEQPEIPASYYGEVEIEGFGDAPVGTEVTAIAGDEQDTITVEEAGEYGGPGPFDDKLVLQDPGDDTDVTFRVDGPGFEETVAETDPATVTWESEDVQEVNLTLTGVTVFDSIDLRLDGVDDERQLEVGETTTATVIADVSGGDTEDVTSESTITSNDTDVATVSGNTITAESTGETTIQAEDTGLEDSVDLVVVEEDDAGGGGGGGGGGGDIGDDGDEIDDVDDDVEAPPPRTPSAEEIEETFDPAEEVTIENAEAAETVFDPQTATSTAVFSEESTVSRVSVGGDISGVGDGEVSVADLDTEPDDAGSSPGRTVSVTQIEVPEEAQNNPGTVDIRVSRDRLEELDADVEDLQINRFADGAYQGLETVIVNETASEVLLRADTPGFSIFTVSAVSDPEAEFSVDPVEPDPDTQVTFDASAASDRYGEVVAYNWRINGESLSGEVVESSFEELGDVEVELTVENDAGRTDNVTQTVTVSGPVFEVPDIDAPDSREPGDEVTVSATIENTGNEVGEQAVSYEFAGQTSETTVELEPGETRTVEFTATGPEEEGEFTHTVATLNDEATATTLIESPPILLALGIVLLVLGAAAGALYAGRRTGADE